MTEPIENFTVLIHEINRYNEYPESNYGNQTGRYSRDGKTRRERSQSPLSRAEADDEKRA